MPYFQDVSCPARHPETQLRCDLGWWHSGAMCVYREYRPGNTPPLDVQWCGFCHKPDLPLGPCGHGITMTPGAKHELPLAA